MQPLSNDLRKRILDAVDNHEGSRRKLAARFKVNTSTITRLLQLRRETGSFEPRPHGGGVEPTLDHDALERLRELVEETPDATLETLKQKMGVSGSRMIICRALQKLGPAAEEEVHARLRAGHARGPGGTPRVRRGGRADRAQTARFRGRDRGHHGDDAHLRPGPARGAGRGVGPGVVGVGDGDRGDGAGRGPGPAGVRGCGQRGDVPDRTWSRSWCRRCVAGTWWSSTT